MISRSLVSSDSASVRNGERIGANGINGLRGKCAEELMSRGGHPIHF
jgi:hypothetical protein